MTTLEQATIAELEAALEAKKAAGEPDWEAAVEAFCDAYDRDCYGSHESSVRLGLIAALPLAPTPAPMGEAEIAEIARRISVSYVFGNAETLAEEVEAIADFAIRETLKLSRPAVRWPGEG